MNLLLVQSNTTETDITISFLPCHHSNLTTISKDLDFVCNKTFAHAFLPPVGDIHLNSELTWGADHSDTTTCLYSITLHELGHSLGLGHSSNLESVMYGNFNGSRAHARLTLHQEDIQALLDGYPIVECRDDYYYPATCPNSYCRMGMVEQCRLTCGQCDPNKCRDTYVKCHRDVCNVDSDLRQACRKTCEMCDCKGPVIEQGVVTPLRGRYYSKERVRFGCVAGYELVGAWEGVCEAGAWSAVPSCSKVTLRGGAQCGDVIRSCKRKKRQGRCGKKRVRVKCKRTCGYC